MNTFGNSYIQDYLSVICNITFTFGHYRESASKNEYIVNSSKVESFKLRI